MVIDFNSIASSKKLHATRRKQDITSGKLLELCNFRPAFVRQPGKSRSTPKLPAVVQLYNQLDASPNYFLSDSVTNSKEDMIDNLNRILLSLSPDQFDFVFEEIRVMIDELSDVNK